MIRVTSFQSIMTCASSKMQVFYFYFAYKYRNLQCLFSWTYN